MPKPPRPRAQAPLATPVALPGASVVNPPNAGARHARGDVHPQLPACTASPPTGSAAHSHGSPHTAPTPQSAHTPITRAEEPSRAPPTPGAPDIAVEPPAGAALRGVGRAADGPSLSPALNAACKAAAAHPARFSSFRNLHSAGEAELRAAPLPTVAPPPTPIQRRSSDLAATNPWPLGLEERRPTAIDDLFNPGVYAALEVWLVDGEGPRRSAKHRCSTRSLASSQLPHTCSHGRRRADSDAAA